MFIFNFYHFLFEKKEKMDVKKFSMVVEENLVKLEVNLSEEQCEIINIELIKEADYWRNIVSKIITSEDEYQNYCKNAPKRRVLCMKKKKKNTKDEASIAEVLKFFKSKFVSTVPTVSNYIPNPEEKPYTIKDLESCLMKYGQYMIEVENFCLKNSYSFGNWLCAAHEVYRMEKYVLKNKELPSTFEKWVKRCCGISKTQICNYRNLAKLIQLAPRLIHCRVSLKCLLEKYNLLTIYFKNNKSLWCHHHNCNCEECCDYFSV